MRRFGGWIGLAGILLLGVGFAAANAGRLVTIDLGILTLYRVPVTFVAFGGMVAGMGIMLLAGIHADLKVRDLLRREGALEDDRGEPPTVDGRREEPLGGTLSDPSRRLDELPESWDRTASTRELPLE
jgi:hypothetical protein